MQISSGVSNTFLFAPAPYYKLDKGFFLGFLFKPLGGLCPRRGLNKKASEKYPLSITCCSTIVFSFLVFEWTFHKCDVKNLNNTDYKPFILI